MSPSSSGLEPVFHALSDPMRLAMVERLCQGPATVGELAGPLPVALPSIVKHLKVLESAGLVRSHKTGRVRTCEIDHAMLATIEGWVSQRRAAMQRQFDRLGDYLAAQADAADTGDPT